MKIIIFDSGTLISFAINGLYEELKLLKSQFDGKFIITDEVKSEIIDKPINTKRFELEALKLKKLIDDKVFEFPNSLNIDHSLVSKKTQQILDISNNTFTRNNKPIHIIDLGEASCLALGKILNEMKIKNVISVDERTLRLLCEKPENLRKLLQKKLHTNIGMRNENLKFFEGFQFIRSAELVYVAYKKGIINLNDERTLDALLYAVKFSGCSITDIEIEEIKKIK